MTASGLSAQAGIKIESTPGTRVAVDNFAELVSESIKVDHQKIRPNGIRAGRRTRHRIRNGGKLINGSISVVLAPQGLGEWLQAAFGAVSTTGAGPYTHTFTPGNVRDDTFTLQMGKPRVNSTTVDVFEYAGCNIADWSISAEAGSTSELEATFGITALTETLNQTIVSASYASGYQGFVWTEGALTVGGAARDVMSVSIQGDNGLTKDRLLISSTTPTAPKQAMEGGLRNYTGSLRCDYDARTLYDAYLAGTELALSLAFTSGSTSLTIAGNIHPLGETPSIAGPQNLEQPFNFEFVSSTSDAAAITVTLINADSTP